MANAQDIKWFKETFGRQVNQAIAGTPLTLDFMAALACQETGEIWSVLRKKGLGTGEILKLCVGDTIDAKPNGKGRRAFPKTKSELVAAPRGSEMFAIARQALIDMAAHIAGYRGMAAMPNKFCHGFGMFQRDLQFFKADPHYFLNRDYEKFQGTLTHAVAELKRGLAKLRLDARPSLSDLELAAVGIVYNTGGYKASAGLKQGYFDGAKYYGESLFDYLRLAHAVPVGGEASDFAPLSEGSAQIAPPPALASQGELKRVSVTDGMLRLRKEPELTEPPQRNVVAHLPDGQLVRVLSRTARNGFLHVQTSLLGAVREGWASKKFLVAATGARDIPVATPSLTAPAAIPAIGMPPKAGLVTRRRDVATARSLNEPGQPGRKGTTPDELRAELAALIDWLDVENPQHRRYQPREGLTFCNIYAHDYCHLAGVYLPRVWWTPTALMALAQGKVVDPHLGSTIAEVRANHLHEWLRDFGLSFGWRAAGSLTELQTEVNQGAVGVIVALRKESRKPGHISVVVPETLDHRARRAASGEVVAPLQSQAGTSNFRHGPGKTNWWLGTQFADFGFWLHP